MNKTMSCVVYPVRLISAAVSSTIIRYSDLFSKLFFDGANSNSSVLFGDDEAVFG